MGSNGCDITCMLLLLTCVGCSMQREGCKSPQYLEVGKEQVIQCFFGYTFVGVHWYNSTETLHNEPILSYSDSEKSGEGYTSKEFDIYQNGSLIIRSVGTTHEGLFTAIIFYSKTDDPVYYYVRVETIVTPLDPFPEVSNCSLEVEICLQQFHMISRLTCVVRNARPAMTLGWKAVSAFEKRNVSSYSSVTRNNSVYTSHATVLQHSLSNSSLLSLYVCATNPVPGIFDKHESLVLVRNDAFFNVTAIEPIAIYIEQHSPLKLNFSTKSIICLVWEMRHKTSDEFQPLISAVLLNSTFVEKYDDGYELYEGALVVSDASVKNDGTYRCIGSDGIKDTIVIYDVVGYVSPVPPYPVVNNCYHQHCILEVPFEGDLKCSVRGVRPRVSLKWEEVVKDLGSTISFYESHLSFEEEGDVFNVYLTSKYRLNYEFATRSTVECKMFEGHIKTLNTITRLDLIFSNDGVVSHNDSSQTTDKTNTSKERKHLWVIAVVIGLVAVCILAVILKGYTNKKRARSKSTDLEEGIELLLPEGKLKLFLDYLKETYKNQYVAIQPIPYIRERLFCVGRVFVEGGFEFLHQSVGQKGHEIWEHLKSYHDIFQNDHLKSSRRILEGEPGYGKSTLALQMAYEWCESIPESPMQTVGILIFLRMRQLEGVSSIYEAIKRFLLAKDIKLDESDIEDILSNTSSVLFILDGFDEFPGSIDECESDFDYIIRNEMFQKFDVILTTRSSCLPNNYAPSSKRIRLTGFDDRARNDYIRKAVVGHDTGVDNTEVVDGIKTRLEENPVLNDLCQVPLLFVMFAHMTYEKEEFQKFNSVTSFFKHMIASFHSHMKNKMKDRNVRKWNVNEVNHQKLDEIAFEGLTSTNQKTTWNKEELSIRTGEKFYRQYRDLGILVEEDVLDIGGKSGVDFTYKKKTRFYHKLFCEWYAAHHLADILGNHGKETNNKKPNKVLNAEETKKLLESLNPFDLQYVFRFACGLNNDAAGIIIQYLQRIEEFEKFAVLCILERDDKTENIVESVRDLCSSTINILGNDSLLLQRSSIQLLEIAAANGIIVSRVCLTNSFKSVNVIAGRLHLTSELYLPALSTIKEILIRERARTMTEEEIETLLKFATKCKRLKTIIFHWSLLPQSIQVGPFDELRQRRFKVEWSGLYGYRLNMNSGQWEHDDGRKEMAVMTDENYREEEQWIVNLQNRGR